MTHTHPAPMSSAEACKELGDIDRSTLSRWVALGLIVPAYKLPGRNGAFVFDRAEVERVKAERAA